MMNNSLQFQQVNPLAPHFSIKFKETQQDGSYCFHNLISSSHIDTFQSLSDSFR
jgi:hypothetical protein